MKSTSGVLTAGRTGRGNNGKARKMQILFFLLYLFVHIIPMLKPHRVAGAQSIKRLINGCRLIWFRGDVFLVYWCDY